MPPGTPCGRVGQFFRLESVPYLSEYVCQMWLRSDGRECHAGKTIAKCTKTAASSYDSNYLSRTPAAWFASGRLITGDPIGISGVKYICVAIRSLVHLPTKIDEFVCQPNISQTVAVRTVKLAHRPRIASTTIKLISKQI